ncbi:hypothetical protein NliqN6_0394 [Naganishia liquefaciens]|uniref:Uncharacterized protein n=1 Tax=Naganishia liquefaciens TaxID=104408 RepID=A0A8H3TMX2_9TREE|nr:hypothetical protein NliqN6_0394 [Naganishia liquefaciens]
MSTTTPLFPTAPTSSDLFYNPRTATTFSAAATTSSNNNSPGYGWGGGGYGNGQSAYFQTVVISLVALAVLLVISVMFLYYRRRRLRYYRGEEWPFPTLPANGRPGRRRKEEKDYGEVPEMYECLLDVKGDDDGSKHAHPASEDVWGGMPTAGRAGSAYLDEDLVKWQPVTVTSLDTRAIPANTAAENPTSGTTASGRPTSLFARTLSTGRNVFTASGGVQSVDNTGADMTPGAAEHGLSTYTPSTGTAHVPLSVTYLIAMPSAQRTTETQRRPSAVTSVYEGDDIEGQEIPELELGLTGVHLEVSGLSVVTPGQRAVTLPTQGEDETNRRRRYRKSHQAATGAGGQAGEAVPNTAIASDGTLDLFALLNQAR